MRTIACKTVWALLVGVSLVLSLNSCSKDPVIPEDETKNKLHEDPAKMTVRLVECHLHADWNEIQKAGGPHQNPESPARYMKRVQEITYELKAGSGWTLAEVSKAKSYAHKIGENKNRNNVTPPPAYRILQFQRRVDERPVRGERAGEYPPAFLHPGERETYL